jgi:hypothetical protein
MNRKLFIKLFYFLITVFIVLNAIIWFTWTKDITSPTSSGGDLLRIGYIYGFVAPRTQGGTISRRHIEVRDYNLQPVDMVTLGDSFSIGSYQNHLASSLGISILNIPTQKGSSFYPVPMLARLINSGYLDRIKPKYLLLQTAEREAVSRLADLFSLTDSSTIEELEKEFHRRSIGPEPSDLDRNLHFINNGNWKFIANNIQYRFRDKAYKSEVVMSQLKRPYFSTRRGDMLIFHSQDITAARKANPKSIAAINDNLNQLADVLSKKGITLIFMPAPDKLTMYEPYLKKRSYPKSIFFEELRKLPKRYTFIDTKQILSRELAAGVQDLYHQDDTHWSWKAPEAIAKNFPRLPGK